MAQQQQTEPRPHPRPGRAPYETPAVVYETALEVHAGSPLGIPQLPDWGNPAQ